MEDEGKTVRVQDQPELYITPCLKKIILLAFFLNLSVVLSDVLWGSHRALNMPAPLSTIETLPQPCLAFLCLYSYVNVLLGI